MAEAPVIYLIDDDDVYQYTFIKGLEECISSDQMKVFSDGERALEFIKDNLEHAAFLPDIIFLDINMPLMDGWEFMEFFMPLTAAMVKKAEVYMVSSSIDNADMQRAKAIQEVKEYLVKPIDLDYLSAIVCSGK